MNANTTTSAGPIWRRLWIAGASLALLAAGAAAQSPQSAEPASDVKVTDYGTVTLTVKDTDLSQVLEMLAIQSRKNIIAGPDISATVSANLYDVTFYEALDAILRINGYGYMEEGNFIYVYTQQELDDIQTRSRKTSSRVYELEFLSAGDAFKFIQPLLSDVGAAEYLGDVQTGIKPDIGDAGGDSYAFTPKLVVNDYVENLDQVSALLAEIDRQPQQVLVEATILQSNLDEENAYGVDFALIGNLDFTDLTNPLSAVDNLLSGNQNVPGSDIEADDSNGFQPGDNEAYGGQVTVGNTGGPGGLKLGLVHNDIAIFLRVLDEVTDNTVLARPKIMCLNRQRAEVLVGARVGYLSTTATQTTTTQTVEFLDTGIQLIFRPFIGRNGNIRMELAPSVSEASLRTVTDANGLLVTIPDELTNELTTNVIIPEGQTLVLGGLFRESTRISRRQVPFLGDIPVIGSALFRGQDDVVARDEIIFLITPSIVENEQLAAAGSEMQSYADALRLGARRKLLPWSREKLEAQYNQKATDAFLRGDTEKALYYANNSLRIDANQPHIVRFREQITGAPERSDDRSLMDRVLRRKLGAVAPDGGLVEVQVASTIIPGPGAYVSMGITPPGFNPTLATAGSNPGNPPGHPGAATPANVPSTHSPLSIEQQQFTGEIFRSFFRSLQLSGATPTAAAPGADSVEFPFETFDDMSSEMGLWEGPPGAAMTNEEGQDDTEPTTDVAEVSDQSTGRP
jgi:type IV pilus assembly protein PilQ